MENKIKPPYLLSIEDPTRYQGIKIPDSGCIASAVGTVINNYQFTVSGAGTPQLGIGGAIFGWVRLSGRNNEASLIPNVVTGSTDIGNFVFGCSSTSGTTGPVLSNCPYSGTLNILTSNGFSSGNFFEVYASSIRIVSAKMEITCLGSNFTNQGEITFGYAPPYVFDELFYAGAQYITTGDLKNIPGAQYCPIAQNKCWAARYLPLDPTSNTYVDNDDTSNATSNPLRDRGCFFVSVAGASTTVPVVFDIKTTFNYEYIPLTSVVSFARGTPGDIDPIGLSLALNHAKSISPTMVEPTMSEVTSTPLSSPGPGNGTLSFGTKRGPGQPLIIRAPIIHAGPTYINSVGNPLLMAAMPFLGKMAMNVTSWLVDKFMPNEKKSKNNNAKKPQSQVMKQSTPAVMRMPKKKLERAVTVDIDKEKKLRKQLLARMKTKK